MYKKSYDSGGAKNEVGDVLSGMAQCLLDWIPGCSGMAHPACEGTLCRFLPLALPLIQEGMH